jgi:SAM-dependent methyltransferase
MYSSFAKYYELIFPMSPPARDLIQGFVTENSRLLELGCGTGQLLKCIQAKHCVGLDIEPAVIELAKSNTDKTREFFCCDLSEFGPTKSNGEFEVIFSLGNVISHIHPVTLKQWLVEIKRLLVPGGLWIFHTIHWDDILPLEKFEYPALPRGETIFDRSYGEISPESVTFTTKLRQGESLVFEQQQKLFPHTEKTLRSMHEPFQLLHQWADYSKKPPAGISRVYCFRKVD